MKKIQLGGYNKSSIKGYAIVDDEYFDYLNIFRWSMDKDGYAYRTEGTHRIQKRILMSREITNAPWNMDVDHKDRDILNNQKDNLRICTRAQNNMNAKVRKNSKSGLKGVYFDKKKQKFEAYTGINGRHNHLGYFSTARDAAIAYNNEVLIKYKEFAKLNKI
jgi:hypothetical protein